MRRNYSISEGQSHASDESRAASLLASDGTASPGRGGFLGLPSEVMHLICAQLCCHCRDIRSSEPFPDDYEGFHRDNQVLHALSQACIILRDIAQPFLYHVPCIKRYGAFLRTLRDRPDLADRVRRLPSVRIMYAEQIDRVMASNRFALIKEMAAELQMITSQDLPFEQEFPAVLTFLTNTEDSGLIYERALQIATLDTLVQGILIASLPCLEAVYIRGWEGDGCYPPEVYHHSKRRLERVGRLVSDRCADASISSLDTIVIENWRKSPHWWEQNEDNSDNRHIDSVHLDPHEFLFTCASSLKQLIFDGCDAPYYWPATSRGPKPTTIWSTLPNLHTIVFHSMVWAAASSDIDQILDWGAMPVDQQDVAYRPIQQMMTECTSLRSFKISVVPLSNKTTNGFSPNKLVQSLMPAASRLETLSIHAHKIRPRSDTDLLIGTALRPFTALKNLSLPEDCFCKHWIYENDQDGLDAFAIENERHPEAYSCLVNTLPTSVTSLNIRLRKRVAAVPEILHLGKAVLDGLFPNLKRITIEASLWVLKASIQQGRHRTSNPCCQYERPTEESAMQDLAAKLEEAFQGSGVLVEVVSLRNPMIDKI